MLLVALSAAYILLLLIFSTITIVAFLVILTGLTSLTLDVPFVRTPKRVYPFIEKGFDVQPGDVVYELGSGDGSLLLYLADQCREATYVGIERHPLLCLWSRLRATWQKKSDRVTFRRENLFDTDLSKADKVYVYLLNTIMQELLPKCQRELKNARLISRAFPFSKKSPVATMRVSEKDGTHGEHMLYVYEF